MNLYPPQNNDDKEPDLLSPPGKSSVRADDQPVEDLAHELAEQQERLLHLKRQQEEVEARKLELEDLSRRRVELSSGQKTMREKFSRALTVLERAELDTQREIEQIRQTRESFAEHFDIIDAINPKEWGPNEVDDELTRALSKIDHAQSIYSQARARLDALSDHDLDQVDEDYEDGADPGDLPFSELLRRGFALTLPLIILLSVIAFLIFIKS